MKKTLLITIAALSLFIASCKKDAPDFTGYDISDASTNASQSYLPVSKGSYWKYAIDNLGSLDTSTQTMTGKTTVINGKLYNDISISSTIATSSTGYFYAHDHRYALRANSLKENITLELVVLVDTVAIGHTWLTSVTDDGLVNGVPSRLTGTMIEKGITKTIFSKAYKDVVHTTMDVEYDLGDGFSPYSHYDVYIVKGIGIIEIDTEFFGIPVGKSKLFEYSIK